jgi:hypothetical protein
MNDAQGYNGGNAMEGRTMTTILYGTLRDDGTLQLDDKVKGLPPGRVRIMVEEAPAPRTLTETMGQIRRDQEARGYRGRSHEEMLAEEERERVENEEYEEYWRRIWAQTQTGIPK